MNKNINKNIIIYYAPMCKDIFLYILYILYAYIQYISTHIQQKVKIFFMLVLKQETETPVKYQQRINQSFQETYKRKERNILVKHHGLHW